LSWEADAGADSYIVKRTEFSSGGVNFDDAGKTVTKEITGKTSYIDNTIAVDKSYAYRLDKGRGGIVFEGSEITMLGKTRPDPFYGIIGAQHLNNGKSAYLTWQADAGADEYRIMRALNSGSSVSFSARQSGADGFLLHGATSAVDGNLQDDMGYLYRLDKRRDSEWIIGKEICVFSQARPLPFPEAPAAASFRADGYIALSWLYDEGADSYILKRKKDGDTGLGQYVTIYEGTELQYTDNTVDSDHNGRYVYLLCKRRNGSVHQWEEKTTAAVAVRTQQDRHEPNNIDTQATVLDSRREGNLYYFAYSTSDIVVQDIDWYKVSIPAGKTASISVSYSNPAGANYFLLYNPHKESKSIIHNTPFQITNDDDVQKYVYFAIMPDKTHFMPMNYPGGDVVSYTINWKAITDY
jgi:hypothetical protein